jgi:two-component system, chemotaxis family, chemotaxis protein CheY
MRCLIVEDDTVSSMALEQMMKKYGSCEVVTDGSQAAERFQQAHAAQNPFNLILMDIMMPEVDGLQAVLNIRKSEADMGITYMHRVKVIMTTALTDPRTVMKALYEVDANSYLIKPIRVQKLEEELRALNLIS